jgi:hypothetical protein
MCFERINVNLLSTIMSQISHLLSISQNPRVSSNSKWLHVVIFFLFLFLFHSFLYQFEVYIFHRISSKLIGNVPESLE